MCVYVRARMCVLCVWARARVFVYMMGAEPGGGGGWQDCYQTKYKWVGEQAELIFDRRRGLVPFAP